MFDNLSNKAKIAYVSLISLLGTILRLAGLFTPLYRFGVGLIIAIHCWVGSGILAKYREVKEVRDFRGATPVAATSAPTSTAVHAKEAQSCCIARPGSPSTQSLRHNWISPSRQNGEPV